VEQLFACILVPLLWLEIIVFTLPEKWRDRIYDLQFGPRWEERRSMRGNHPCHIVLMDDSPSIVMQFTERIAGVIWQTFYFILSSYLVLQRSLPQCTNSRPTYLAVSYCFF